MTINERSLASFDMPFSVESLEAVLISGLPYEKLKDHQQRLFSDEFFEKAKATAFIFAHPNHLASEYKALKDYFENPTGRIENETKDVEYIAFNSGNMVLQHSNTFEIEGKKTEIDRSILMGNNSCLEIMWYTDGIDSSRSQQISLINSIVLP